MVGRGPELIVNSNASESQNKGKEVKTKGKGPEKIATSNVDEGGSEVKVLGKEEADATAKEALKLDDTKAVLDKMKKIDERMKTIKNMPELERLEYSRAIETYNNIINDIQKRMEEDLNFKEAVKQMGMNLDMEDQSLNALEEPEAGNEASMILNNKEAEKQIHEGIYVMASTDKLSPSQQKAIDDRSNYTKTSVETLANQLGLG